MPKFQVGDIARTYIDHANIFITGTKDLLYQFYYMEKPDLTGEELIDYANNYWRLIRRVARDE